jgi:hypothetical protein
MTYVWIPIAAIIGIFWISKKLEGLLTQVPAPVEPERVTVKFFEGPLHDHTEPVADPQAYYIAAYIPDTDDPTEYRGIPGFGFKYALYQQALDENYVYRRDLTDNELKVLSTSGKLPPEFTG